MTRKEQQRYTKRSQHESQEYWNYERHRAENQPVPPERHEPPENNEEHVEESCRSSSIIWKFSLVGITLYEYTEGNILC